MEYTEGDNFANYRVKREECLVWRLTVELGAGKPWTACLRLKSLKKGEFVLQHYLKRIFESNVSNYLRVADWLLEPGPGRVHRLAHCYSFRQTQNPQAHFKATYKCVVERLSLPQYAKSASENESLPAKIRVLLFRVSGGLRSAVIVFLIMQKQLGHEFLGSLLGLGDKQQHRENPLSRGQISNIVIFANYHITKPMRQALAIISSLCCHFMREAFLEEAFPLDKSRVFKAFLSELIRVSKLVGVSPFKFMVLYLRYGFLPLDSFRYGAHYSLFPVVRDEVLLRKLSYSLDLSFSSALYRTVNFAESESASLFELLKTYSSDKALKDPYHVSLTTKESSVDRYARFRQKIILDHCNMSFYRRPAYYLVQEDDRELLVIRGSCNAYDGFTDLDFTQEEHHGYYFHGGFWAAANLLYEELLASQLLRKDQLIEIHGHSMGASIAVIVSFLLIQNEYQSYAYCCGMSCVADFNFYVKSKEFCCCVVNGFDFVPTISYHAEAVYLARTILRQHKIREKDICDVESVREFDDKTVVQNFINEDEEASIFWKVIAEFKKEQYIPPTRVLSELLTKQRDLFIAGECYHYIKGRLYEISVHDISDIYFTMSGLLDHQGYLWVSEELGKKEPAAK